MKGTPQKAGAFLTDVRELRRRARIHIERGAVTDSYQADRKTVLALLNTALATELVCVLRYRRHYFMASGIHAQGDLVVLGGVFERLEKLPVEEA
jgi:bacterioferritin